jgi:hypothetical protein
MTWISERVAVERRETRRPGIAAGNEAANEAVAATGRRRT